VSWYARNKHRPSSCPTSRSGQDLVIVTPLLKLGNGSLFWSVLLMSRLLVVLVNEAPLSKFQSSPFNLGCSGLSGLFRIGLDDPMEREHHKFEVYFSPSSQQTNWPVSISFGVKHHHHTSLRPSSLHGMISVPDSAWLQELPASVFSCGLIGFLYFISRAALANAASDLR